MNKHTTSSQAIFDFTAQAIGGLTEQVKAVNDRLDREHEEFKQRDKDTASSREEFKEALSHLEVGHREIIRRVDEMEPVTKMVSSYQAKMAGAVIVLGFIGTIAFAGMALFKERILHFFGW